MVTGESETSYFTVVRVMTPRRSVSRSLFEPRISIDVSRARRLELVATRASLSRFESINGADRLPAKMRPRDATNDRPPSCS